jgi:hypothetical protein
MTKPAAPARRLLLDLAAADDAIAEHGRVYLSPAAPESEWRPWFAKRDALCATRDAVLREVGRLLCKRCDGFGVLPQFRHRLHGECFQCHGDGWSSAGRKRVEKQ